jgi:hypothetical protein
MFLRQVFQMEHELLTLCEPPELTPALSEVHVAQSLVFCIMFCG